MFPLRRLLAEKALLFVLAGATAVLALLAQSSGGAVASLENFPPAGRLANAVTAYAGYAGKAAWPTGLAAFYPHVGSRLPWLHSVITGLLLAVPTALAFRMRRGRPALLWGWLWYLVTLLPVSGLIQVGNQGIADRYAYVPLLGLLVALVWVLPVAGGARGLGIALRVATLSAAAVLVALTARQVRVWKDDVTLLSQVLRVNPRFSEVHLHLGRALRERGRFAESAAHFQAALALCPECWDAHFGMANHLLTSGRPEEALVHYRAAARLAPARSEAHNNLGVALVATGRAAEAEAAFAESLRLDERNHEAHTNLGKSLLARDGGAEARRHFERALEIDALDAEAHLRLGEMLLAAGAREAGLAHLREAERIRR